MTAAERKAKTDMLADVLADASKVQLNPFALESLRLAARGEGAAAERRAILREVHKRWDDGDQGWVDFDRWLRNRAKAFPKFAPMRLQIAATKSK